MYISINVVNLRIFIFHFYLNFFKFFLENLPFYYFNINKHFNFKDFVQFCVKKIIFNINIDKNII
jgi:hypothetical protein